MRLEPQLLHFTTSDKKTLHGLLFTLCERKSDLALLLVHGVAMNFYLPPLALTSATRGWVWFPACAGMKKLAAPIS